MNHALLMATISIAILPAAAKAADIIPIQRGYYVSKDTPCQEASNATISLYTGDSFGQAHLKCRTPSTQKLPDGSYVVTRSCRDMQGSGGKWEKLQTSYKVIGPMEFVETTDYGQFAFRYCPQSDLPWPWNSSDLSSTGGK